MLPDSKSYFYFHAAKAKLRWLLKTSSGFRFYINYYLVPKKAALPDIMIISYPKSGRTWLEQLVLAAQAKTCGVEHSDYATYLDLCRKFPQLPTIEFSHGGSSWESLILDEDDMITYRAENYARGKRTVFLYRDPRDVLVSSYYHIKNRTGISDIELADMISNKIVGFRKIIRFMNVWRAWSDANEGFDLNYEALRRNSFKELKKMSNYLGLGWKQEVIQFAIDECNFSKMQKAEEKGNSGNPWLTPTNSGDKNSFKVRSGKSGEYQKLYNKSDREIINSIMRTELNIAFPYH